MLTVPSMMKGVQEAQYKTGFKKAYNTISNLTAMLAVEGKMPVLTSGATTIDPKETARFFIAMMENMSVREVAQSKINSREVASRNSEIKLSYNINNNEKDFGNGATTVVINDTYEWPAATNDLPWITTDDGVAYTLITGTKCSQKNVITTKNTIADLLSESCLAIITDVNGLNKTPNLIEPQSDIAQANQNADMTTLTGDQYYIFVGRDGITTGSKLSQAGARIVSDMK